jgi:hypothetical protein
MKYLQLSLNIIPYPQKIMPVLLILFLFSVNSLAQQTGRIEITPFYGWKLGGKINQEGEEININDSNNFGFSFNFPIPNQPGLRGEIYYSRQNSRLTTKEDSTLTSAALFNMSVEYFQAGATYQENHGIFSPTFLITVGATRFSPKHSQYKDEWRVSAALGFGLKAYFTNHFGIRLQTRLFVPLQVQSGNIFCSNNLCLISLKSGAVALQGDITVGLIIAL